MSILGVLSSYTKEGGFIMFDVAKRITDLCEEKNISTNMLSTKSKVPPSTLKNIVYGISKNPGIVTIEMLCGGLGITIQEFFECEQK